MFIKAVEKVCGDWGSSGGVPGRGRGGAEEGEGARERGRRRCHGGDEDGRVEGEEKGEVGWGWWSVWIGGGRWKL